MSEQDFNKIFAKNLNKILSDRDVSQVELAKAIGVSGPAVNTWCRGLKTPRMDKVDAICNYFHIRRSDLISENPDEAETAYFLDKETADLVQFLHDSPEYKVLFDASRKVKKEDIDFVKRMIDKFGDDND